MTYTGYLEVEVGKKRNKNVITNSYFDGVFKITRPSYLSSGLPVLTLIHVGGGFVDGDSYFSEIMVNDSASLALTTQASTKVYKSQRYGVTQTMNFFLKENSELYVKQDSLIPFMDARYKQDINVYMSSSAIFSFNEIITPGWSLDGKIFTYDKVATKMKIFVDGELKVFDHLLLQPVTQLDKIMMLEGYTHVGTMYYIDERIDNRFIEALRREIAPISLQSRMGISLLQTKGMCIRILANSTPEIETIFSACEDYIRCHLDKKEKFEWRKC